MTAPSPTLNEDIVDVWVVPLADVGPASLAHINQVW